MKLTLKRIKDFVKRHLIILFCAVPLSILSVISLIFHYVFKYDKESGFFINLAIELIGIVITVGFVDWIIKRNNLVLWSKTDLRLSYKLQRYITIFIREINSLCDLPTIKISIKKDEDIWKQQYIFYNNYMRVKLVPEIRNYLAKYDQIKWGKYNQLVDLNLSKAYKIHQLMGHYFQPEYYHLFIDIVELLEEMKNVYQVSLNAEGIVDDTFDEELGESMHDFLIHMTNKYLIILFKKFERISEFLIITKDEVPFFSPYHEDD